MITKNDLILMLSNLKDAPEKEKYIASLIGRTGEELNKAQLGALRYINEHRSLEIVNFYEKLRKSYNAKKSDLYVNIVRDIDDPTKVLTTLASLNLQILLYSKKIERPEEVVEFFKQVRAEELTRVLNNYYKTYDLTSCVKLLRLYKVDLMCLEYVNGRRVL